MINFQTIFTSIVDWEIVFSEPPDSKIFPGGAPPPHHRLSALVLSITVFEFTPLYNLGKGVWAHVYEKKNIEDRYLFYAAYKGCQKH